MLIRFTAEAIWVSGTDASQPKFSFKPRISTSLLETIKTRMSEPCSIDDMSDSSARVLFCEYSTSSSRGVWIRTTVRPSIFIDTSR